LAKVTATQFAAESRCDKNRITRHLHAWDLFVHANRDDPRGLPGLLFSHELVPGQEIDLDVVVTEGAGTPAETVRDLPERLRFEGYYSDQVRLANPRSQTPAPAATSTMGRTRFERQEARAAARVATHLDPYAYRNLPGGVPPQRHEPIMSSVFDMMELDVRAARTAAQSALTSWDELIEHGVPDEIPGDGRRPAGSFDMWRRDMLPGMAVMIQLWTDFRVAMEEYGIEARIDLRDVTETASARG
jgi:hypothetical protein